MALILLPLVIGRKRSRGGTLRFRRQELADLPMILAYQLAPGSFTPATHHLMDTLNLSGFNSHCRQVRATTIVGSGAGRGLRRAGYWFRWLLFATTRGWVFLVRMAFGNEEAHRS